MVTVDGLIITHPYPKTTKAEFRYGSFKYTQISITDTAFYDVPDSTQINKATLIVSLSDTPFMHDYSGEYRYYKFIAKIFRH